MSANTMIAETILRQLGANRFVAMTGAKDLMAVEKGLTFRLTIGKMKRVTITLNGADLYDMKFMKIRKVGGVPTVTFEKNVNDVSADQMADIFEAETGLYTHL